MPLLVAFAGGRSGPWRIERIEGVSGEPFQAAARLSVGEGAAAAHAGDGAAWVLRGVTSNERYVTRREHDELAARQQPLGRPGSTRAALIPIKKSEAWWELAQDERRRIFEESSRHVATSLDYLPAVARRLHHGRDLGEPFDFLTWFEFAPEDATYFEELVRRLRATEEWSYVEREVDLRLARDYEPAFYSGQCLRLAPAHEPRRPGQSHCPSPKATAHEHRITEPIRCAVWTRPLDEICRNTNTDFRFCRAQNTHSGAAMAATLRSRLDAISAVHASSCAGGSSRLATMVRVSASIAVLAG